MSTSRGKPLEEFADTFVCPVVLIGPSSPHEFRLNSPARLIADRLGLPSRLGNLFQTNRCLHGLRRSPDDRSG